MHGLWVNGTRVVNEDGIIYMPAGERHWHGAAPGNDSTLLAVTWGTTQWETVAPE